MSTRTATEAKIYWDTKDSSNEGWAYETSDEDGLIESGGIDGVDPDDLEGAIVSACSECGLDLTPDDFDREPTIDGGYATWSDE